MGMDVSAVVVVGYTYEEIYQVYENLSESDEDFPDFDEWKDELNLSAISPYYDAMDKHCVIGRVVQRTSDYDYAEFNFDTNKIAEMTQELTEKLGIVPKIYLLPYVH